MRRKEVNMGFVEWLKEEMRVRHLTQAELARRSGIRQPMIHRWLKGEWGPSANSAFALANGLGLDPEYVLEVAGHRPRPRTPESTELRQLTSRMRYVDWTKPGRLTTIKGIIEAYQREDNEEAKTQSRGSMARSE